MSPLAKNEPRKIAFIPATAFVPGCGFRVSIVVEGEDGHHPTGDWPADGKNHCRDMPDARRPWFWGQTLAEANERARVFNKRNGIDEEDAREIVIRSMAKANARARP